MSIQHEATSKFSFSQIPIPHTPPSELPQFLEMTNRDWISYGVDNSYPAKLIDYYSKSPIHNSIINTKTNLIVGDGPYEVSEVESSERTLNFIQHPNPEENLENLIRKLAKDFEIFGLAYIQIRYSKDRSEIPEIYHVDASHIRWGKKNERNQLTHFWYSRDWSNYRKQTNQPLMVPIFNVTDKKSPEQIIPILNKYVPGVNYYTLPNYISAIDDIQIDIEISNFHLNNIKNGMSPSTFFAFPGEVPPEAERLKIVENIQQYKGANGRKEIVAFYGTSDKQPTVKVLETSNQDKMFLQLQETTLRKILISHQVVNENLVGISTPGKLGSASEVLSNFELFYNQVIKNDQKYILDGLNKVFLYNGMNPIDIQRNKPLTPSLSENILQNILTKKELRVMIGETPEPDPEMIDNAVVQPIQSGETLTKTYTMSKDFYFVKELFTVPEGDDEDLFVWMLGGPEEESCPICKNFSGQMRTLKSWKRRAIPATPFAEYGGTPPPGNPGPYGSFCEADCRCRLVKVV